MNHKKELLRRLWVSGWGSITVGFRAFCVRAKGLLVGHGLRSGAKEPQGTKGLGFKTEATRLWVMNGTGQQRMKFANYFNLNPKP